MQYIKAYLAFLLIVIGFYGCNPDKGEIVGTSDNSVQDSNLYDYSLNDINPTSLSYGHNIGSDYFEGQITLHYFGHQY